MIGLKSVNLMFLKGRYHSLEYTFPTVMYFVLLCEKILFLLAMMNLKKMLFPVRNANKKRFPNASHFPLRQTDYPCLELVLELGEKYEYLLLFHLDERHY